MNFILQRLQLPDTACPIPRMYYTGEGFLLSQDGAKIVFAPGGWVKGDTYFNSFSLGKWKKYTSLDKLALRIKAKGAFRVSVYGISFKNCEVSKENKCEQLIAEQSLAGTGDRHEELAIPDCDFEDELIVWQFTALECGCELYAADYVGTSDTPLHEVRLAIGICTYKREEYLQANLAQLAAGILDNEKSPLHGRVRVFISDNAETLPPSGHPDIHVFPNPNLGGAGGFTRCLIEAKFRSDFHPTHIILMDDDVLLRIGTFEYLYAFLSMEKTEHADAMIGGALFYQDEPNRQYVGGEFLEFDNWKPQRHNLDMRLFKNVFANEYASAEVSYNGWWFCCIPETYVAKTNLPLPIFLHFDDKEYPIRHRVRFIHLNGVCVWHPRFSNKQATATLGYYNNRNAYIFMAETAPERLTVKYLLGMLIRGLKSTLYYRYEMGFLQMRAIDDFLKGIDAFEHTDPLKLHAELSEFNDQWIPWEGDPEQLLKIGKRRRSLKEAFKMSLNCFLPAIRKPREYRYAATYPGVFLKKGVTIVDTAKGVSTTYHKDFRKFIRNLRYFFDVLFELKKTKPIVWEWNRRIGEVQSLDFWEKYLDLKQF